MKGDVVFVGLHEHQNDNTHPVVFAEEADATAWEAGIVREWATECDDQEILDLLDAGDVEGALDLWRQRQEARPVGEYITVFREVIQ